MMSSNSKPPRAARGKKEFKLAEAVTETVNEVEKRGKKRHNEDKVTSAENGVAEETKAGTKSKKTVSKPSASTSHNVRKEKEKKIVTNGKSKAALSVSNPARNTDEEVSEMKIKSQSEVTSFDNVEEIAEKSKPKGKKIFQKKVDNKPKMDTVETIATNAKTEYNKTNYPPMEKPMAKGRQKKVLGGNHIAEETILPAITNAMENKSHYADIVQQKGVDDKIKNSRGKGRAKKVVEEKDSIEHNFIEKDRRRTFVIQTNTEDEVQSNPKSANPDPESRHQKSAVTKTKKAIKDQSGKNSTSRDTDSGKVVDEENKSKLKKAEKKATTTKSRKNKAVSVYANGSEQMTSKSGDNLKSKPTASRKRGSRKTSDEAPTKKQKPEKALKNKAATDYESIDFSNSSKDSRGNPWNMKICSWNVDGIRSWHSKGGLDYIKYEKPDILCLQEVKCPQDKLPAEVTSVPGYHAYWLCSDKDGYAGVGIYTSKLAINVQYGLDDEELDAEGRLITAEYEQFYLICTYAPNAGRGLVTMDKKLRWNDAFRHHVKRLVESKPVIICGDMNVAHQEIDLKNPKSNKKNAGFTPEERAAMTALLGDGYVDTFRRLYPNSTDAYTFWTYMMGSRAKNVGWRLDYMIVSERLAPAVCDSVIRSEVYGSDHCPIALFLHLTGSPKIPSQETP